MKKIYSIVAMASMVLAATFALTSCEQDNEFDNSTKNNKEEQLSEQLGDTVLLYNNSFVYGEDGPKSFNNKVLALDLGFNDSGNLKLRGGMPLNPTDIAIDLLGAGLKQIAIGAGSKAFTETVGYLFGDESSEVKEGLNQINSHVDQITKAIEDIANHVDNIETAQLMRNRMERFSVLNCYTCDQFAKVINSKGDTAKIRAIVQNWGDSFTDDGPTSTTAIAYLNFLTSGLNYGEKPMPAVYDEWVFNSVAWEHEGYEYRENLRLADISLALTTLYMDHMYHTMNNMNTDKINAAFKKFSDIYKASLVKRHPDYLVCQVYRAHMVFRKNLIVRDMKEHPWFPITEKRWKKDSSPKDVMYGEPNNSSSYVQDHTMSLDEAQRIRDFYNNCGKNWTFQEILQSAGFDYNLDPSKRHIMPLNNGINLEPKNWLSTYYYFKYLEAVHANDSKFRCSNFCLGMRKIQAYLRRWQEYKCDDCVFFRPDMVKRYSGMNPELD